MPPLKIIKLFSIFIDQLFILFLNTETLRVFYRDRISNAFTQTANWPSLSFHDFKNSVTHCAR